MCGRAYETYTDEELWLRYLSKRPIQLPDFSPNFNMAPTQLSPVVLVRDGERIIELMRWGLVPAWAKSVKDAAKYSLINAKGEEIAEKRSYKGPFQRQRCIVPLSGFIEWKRDDQTKRPYAIHLKSREIMSVAAVYERWQSKEDGENVDSFSVITTSANDFMKRIHDRQPVILSKQSETAWLDPENKDVKELQKLLVPCPREWLDAYEISTLVNSPKNNRKELLEPVTST